VVSSLQRSFFTIVLFGTIRTLLTEINQYFLRDGIQITFILFISWLTTIISFISFQNSPEKKKKNWFWSFIKWIKYSVYKVFNIIPSVIKALLKGEQTVLFLCITLLFQHFQVWLLMTNSILTENLFQHHLSYGWRRYTMLIGVLSLPHKYLLTNKIKLILLIAAVNFSGRL